MRGRHGFAKDWTFQALKFSNAKYQNNNSTELQNKSSFKRSSSTHKSSSDQQKSAMAGRRIAYIGLPVAAIGGYYFYAAGGDSKVAQKKAEHDVESAKTSLRGQNVSSAEAKKQGEEWAQIAGSKIDNTVDNVRNKVHEADKTISSKVSEAEAKFEKLKNDTASQFDKTKNDTKKELNQTVDSFDKTVERKTSEAKSGISSWFGFGK